MCNITVIIGLPGSGKSHLGRTMSANSGKPFFDDCLTDFGVWDKVLASVANGIDCIIADPGLCIDYVKRRALNEIVDTSNSTNSFHFIYFANEPEVCARNLKDRKDGREVSARFAKDLSKWYTIPTGFSAVKCFEP